jgi:dimethylargininase
MKLFIDLDSPPRIMKAITRAISSAMQDCELTHLNRHVLDLNRARQQHETYNQVLRDLAV